MQKAEKNPLVSVIMPCYNDGGTLEEAVDSLRAQTWQEIEWILIDDGSDDGMTPALEQALSFPRKTLLHTDHIGPAAARNRGIAAAKGEYILPLDADDTIEPTYIEKAVEQMAAHPACGIVYCHADLFGAASGPWELPEYNLRSELLDNCIFVTALFRKQDWEKAGGFCEDFRAGMEDYDFWLSLLEMGREVIQLPEVLFHYRIKEKSRTTRFQHSYADVQETYVRLYQRHKALYREHMDEYCLELRRNLIDQLMLNRKLQAERDEAENLRQEAGGRQRRAELTMLAAGDDPLVEYILAVRARKPRLGRFFDRLLGMKNRIRRLLGREP